MENSVDWQDDCLYSTSQIKFLFEKEKFLDCSFLVGLEPNQKKLSAHKLILAMKSPVFERNFYGSIPFEDNPIIVPDLSADAFGTMIKFMYKEKVNFRSVEEACHVWAAAKKYMVFLLEELCLEHIWYNYSAKNVLVINKCAHLFENELFKEKSFEYMQFYTDNVLAQPEMLHIQLQVLLKIFKEQRLNISSELNLFTFLEKFSEKHELFSIRDQELGDPKNDSRQLDILQNMGKIDSHKTILESVVREAVKEIRFLRLTKDEFTKATHDSKILTAFEKIAILSNIPQSNEILREMPKGFSTDTHRRSGCYIGAPKSLYFHLLARRNQIESSHLQDPCITFQVNRSIWIEGVQLNNSQKSFAYIRLLNKNRIPLSFVCKSVKNDCQSNLYFENPVFIQPFESYSLMSGVGEAEKVTWNNGLTETKFDSSLFSSPQQHGREVKFTFTNITDCFLSKLIFHYPYSKDYNLIFKDADFSE